MQICKTKDSIDHNDLLDIETQVEISFKNFSLFK